MYASLIRGISFRALNLILDFEHTVNRTLGIVIGSNFINFQVVTYRFLTFGYLANRHRQRIGRKYNGRPTLVIKSISMTASLTH
jgi:hypothetical protein